MAKGNSTKGSLETGMLSFARSLQPTEGLFWGTRSADTKWRQPVEVIERGVRGQSSEYKTANPGKSNPQVVEAAAMPLGCDGVSLTFSLWVAPQAKRPWACDKAEVSAAYEDLVKNYAEKNGFDVLARSYLWNIANARFAWRNRFLADHMRVSVGFDGRELVFDPTRLELAKPASLEELQGAVVSNNSDGQAEVESLIKWIRKGLADEKSFLRVAWQGQMEEAQEVFPSQEYLREDPKEDTRKAAPSRVYAKLPRRYDGRTVMQASMHSQKIGAALRHIDVWHGDDDYGAIAVNPYGGVQETGAVLRGTGSKRNSFYDLRSKGADLLARIKAAQGPDDLPHEAHFVVANLVRGGVFGQKADG